MSERIEVRMPDSQQEGTRSVVQLWMKKVGEAVALHEPLLEISTDKVTIEIPAPAAGVLGEILVAENDEVSPGQLLAYLSLGTVESQKSAPTSAKLSAKAPSISTRSSSDAAQELSPAVRKLLKEHNLEASQIVGTGRGGRLTHEDVMAFLEQGAPSTSSGSRRIPHSQMRRSIANHMVESLLKTAPHVTAIFDADLSRILAHREKHKADFENRGAKLTLTSYFVQATVRALQAVPEVNGRWHTDALELFEDCNIGVATALDKGLIVPVIQRAQTLDLFGIAERLANLTARARDNKLSPNEVQGGTFTITNHGVSGSLIATPIINQPQSAILGLGKLEKRAVVLEEKGKETIVARPMIYVTLTIDHRALDGFQANSFLTAFVAALQDF